MAVSPRPASEYLMAEQYVTEPAAFAQAIFEEFYRLIASPGWKSHAGRPSPKDGSCLVESCLVAGPFAASGVFLPVPRESSGCPPGSFSITLYPPKVMRS